MTGLIVTDPDLSYDSLEGIVSAGAILHSAAKFWIGDALNFSEQAYGERYAQMEAATRMDHHSLENIASVCRKVARSRRREELSFSHHGVVARLEPNEQVEWLTAAVENDWSVSEFRDHVRDAVPPKPRGEQPAWTGSEQPQGELMTLTAVEETEKNAQQVLTQTLAAGHPLWESQARSLARDAISLAATAKASLHDVARRAVERAQPYGDIGFWIPRAEFEELRALAFPDEPDDEGGTP